MERLAAEGLLDGGEAMPSADGPAEAAEPAARPSQRAEPGPASELASRPAPSRGAAEPELPPDAAQQQRLALQQVAAALERAFVQRPAPAVSAVGRPSLLPITQQLCPIVGCCRCCHFLLLSSRTPDRD